MPERGMTDPALLTLWQHVVDHWDDQKAHAAFLQHCDATDQLPEAAVRYRGMTGDATRAALAEQKLKGVAALAMAKLEIQRATKPESRHPALGVAVAALFVAGTVGLLIAYGLW